MNVANTRHTNGGYDKRVNLWHNTLKNKQESLQRALGITVVVAIVACFGVLAFADEYDPIKDGFMGLLLAYSVVGCIPHIEVAQVKDDTSLFQKRLTLENWEQTVGRANHNRGGDEYDVFSSNIHVLQGMFPVMTTLSFLLYLVHKVAGEQYVTYNTVLLMLLMQVPFNNFLGLNPLGKFLTRQEISRHVTQSDLKKFVNRKNNASNRRKNNATDLSRGMNNASRGNSNDTGGGGFDAPNGLRGGGGGGANATNRPRGGGINAPNGLRGAQNGSNTQRAEALRQLAALRGT